jgi:hypothetical protein
MGQEVVVGQEAVVEQEAVMKMVAVGVGDKQKVTDVLAAVSVLDENPGRETSGRADVQGN